MEFGEVKIYPINQVGPVGRTTNWKNIQHYGICQELKYMRNLSNNNYVAKLQQKSKY